MSDKWRLGSAVTLAVWLGFFAGRLGSQDRAAAVPGMKVLLENAHVRVVLKPYKARLKLADGTERLVDRKPGDVFWGDPVTHSVQNLGDNDIHNLIVELKDATRD